MSRIFPVPVKIAYFGNGDFWAFSKLLNPLPETRFWALARLKLVFINSRHFSDPFLPKFGQFGTFSGQKSKFSKFVSWAPHLTGAGPTARLIHSVKLHFFLV